MIEPKVVFEAVPSHWVIEYQDPGQDWKFIERKPTLEEAKECAQERMDYMCDGSATLWRVVDTQPEDDTMSINAHQLTVPLTLDAYQQQAKATAVYPEDKAYRYLIAGLAGEVGEVSSIFAKHWRGDGPLTSDKLEAELGDVLWFVAMLADEIGCDLSEVAQNNLDKLADRAKRGGSGSWAPSNQ